MTPIIQVNNLSKKYRIGESQPYITLRDTIAGVFKNPLGKLKEGLQKDEFWALKDINFSVEQGDVVGIIGHNGAGKSTLLKILSRITPPTTGEVILRGRVGSLLEVGTGFQQELTGRENIYLNGAILGMTQSEIKRKFDEIVDFAEVEKFIDTPVKHYSSGMYMRLAFSIAAHLDPEILIVDEVLAVGDAEFQKKCLGKMDEVSKKQGKTVLFVSHDMNAINKLCKETIYLNNGKVEKIGTTSNVISVYHNSTQLNQLPSKWYNSNKNEIASIYSILITGESGDTKTSFSNTETIHLHFVVDINKKNSLLKVGYMLIRDSTIVFQTHHTDSINQVLNTGRNTISTTIPAKTLNAGTYKVLPLISLHCVRSLEVFNNPVVQFTVKIESNRNSFHANLNEKNNPGLIFPLLNWRINDKKNT